MNETAPFLYASTDSAVGRGLAPAVVWLCLMFSAGHKAPPCVSYVTSCIMLVCMCILRQHLFRYGS